jgi:hypothetical protein
VAVLSNTHSQWPDAILIEILRTLLPGRLGEFPAPTGGAADEPPFAPDPELVGSWEGAASLPFILQGFVHTYEREIPLVLEIGESGSVYATLGEQPRTLPF